MSGEITIRQPQVEADLEKLDEALNSLRATKGVKIFHLTEKMLERCSELSHAKLDLQPFDQAILAAILVRAKELQAGGAEEMDFCELDSHLQPWDKDRRPKNRCNNCMIRHTSAFMVISCFRFLRPRGPLACTADRF